MKTEFIYGPHDYVAYKITRSNGFFVIAAPPPDAADPELHARVAAILTMRRLFRAS